jgi:hypothetical protein
MFNCEKLQTNPDLTIYGFFFFFDTHIWFLVINDINCYFNLCMAASGHVTWVGAKKKQKTKNKKNNVVLLRKYIHMYIDKCKHNFAIL